MIWIGSVLGVVILFGIVLCRNYEKKQVVQLNKTQHKLLLLYPFCLYLLNLLEKLGGENKRKKNQKVKKQLQALNFAIDKEENFLWYRCKKMSLAMLIMLAASCFCILSEAAGQERGNLLEGLYLIRQEAGNGMKEVPVHVTIENLAEDSLTIELPERIYTEEEKKEKLQEAKKYIEKHYLGENENSTKVGTKLNLIEHIPDNQIKVNWDIGTSGLIEENGTLKNETVENKKMKTVLSASFRYYSLGKEEILEEVEFPITVLERSYTEKEWVIQEIKKYIETENQQHANEKKLKLPNKIGNYSIHYNEVVEKSSNMILIFGFIAAVVLYFMADKDLEMKMEQRNNQLMIDYPELMNKFILLLGAGMTVRNAWGKIALEYERKKQENKGFRYAYEEWLLTWNEIKNGVSEGIALEQFGRRIALTSYLKFSTLLVQNLKKGSKGLLELLEYEAMDAFEERKEAAKRLGEEAGTKLLMPMMIMLIIVMMIIMFPAFYAMSA